MKKRGQDAIVDSVAGHEYLSMLDGYSGYNQNSITEEDVIQPKHTHAHT